MYLFLERIRIHKIDYKRLAVCEYLNDILIEFYLRYIVLNLAKEQPNQVDMHFEQILTNAVTNDVFNFIITYFLLL